MADAKQMYVEWGGSKQSGIERELGPCALDAYLESEQIYVNLT